MIFMIALFVFVTIYVTYSTQSFLNPFFHVVILTMIYREEILGIWQRSKFGIRV